MVYYLTFEKKSLGLEYCDILKSIIYKTIVDSVFKQQNRKNVKLVRKMLYILLTVFDKVIMNHHKMRGMTFQQSQYTPILFVSMTNVVLNKIQDTTFATQVTRIICTQQFHCIMLECVQGLKSSVSTVCKKTCLGYLILWNCTFTLILPYPFDLWY